MDALQNAACHPISVTRLVQALEVASADDAGTRAGDVKLQAVRHFAQNGSVAQLTRFRRAWLQPLRTRFGQSMIGRDLQRTLRP
jgi:hypothetical protein